MEPFCRQLSSHVCSDFGSPPSVTGGWGLNFGVIHQLYAVYDSRRLRGWNRFAGGSQVTFASILVRLQAKREVGNFVLASFIIFMLCMILAGCAGGTDLPAALYHVCFDFSSPPSKREGDDFVLAFFNKFRLSMILAGCAGGIGLPAAV